MRIQRLASFATGSVGGNPAGVVLCDQLPERQVMQRTAAEVGYSETVFAAPEDHLWRARYFAPEMEVPFCGHATIALGAALTHTHGARRYELLLNHSRVSVEGSVVRGGLFASLMSPRTSTQPVSDDVLDSMLQLFSLTRAALDPRIPPKMMSAGATHLVLAVKDRSTLRDMAYSFAAGRDLMNKHHLVTIMLAFIESESVFHVRNAFAAGGVYEDPATGAAAAALAGYLRELDWSHRGKIKLLQGEDMGCPSEIWAEIPSLPGEPAQVSGSVRFIDSPGQTKKLQQAE